MTELVTGMNTGGGDIWFLSSSLSHARLNNDSIMDGRGKGMLVAASRVEVVPIYFDLSPVALPHPTSMAPTFLFSVARHFQEKVFPRPLNWLSMLIILDLTEAIVLWAKLHISIMSSIRTRIMFFIIQ